MPCDLASNIDKFMYVLSNTEALRVKYIPNYVVCRGDLNTDMCRSNSVHIQTLGNFCHDNNMECVVSQGFSLSYTFESVINNAGSTIDHFIISHSLVESVTKYCFKYCLK